MFLLRCAFWLSIVYTAIFWSHGTLMWHDKQERAVDKRQFDVETLVQNAVTSARDICVQHPSECMADAARLTRLVSDAGPGSASRPSGPAGALAQLVPLPVPDPRRVRDANSGRIP